MPVDISNVTAKGIQSWIGLCEAKAANNKTIRQHWESDVLRSAEQDNGNERPHGKKVLGEIEIECDAEFFILNQFGWVPRELSGEIYCPVFFTDSNSKVRMRPSDCKAADAQITPGPSVFEQTKNSTPDFKCFDRYVNGLNTWRDEMIKEGFPQKALPMIRKNTDDFRNEYFQAKSTYEYIRNCCEDVLNGNVALLADLQNKAINQPEVFGFALFSFNAWLSNEPWAVSVLGGTTANGAFDLFALGTVCFAKDGQPSALRIKKTACFVTQDLKLIEGWLRFLDSRNSH